ncbi:MAG: multidrug efflux RND transporter permease subunit [Pseudomonadota bacterium]
MQIGHFFTDRPVYATVLSIFVIIVGLLAYFGLPVAQYPEVAPPTISVSATYPGASSEVLANTVAAPLEQEINGVEGMLYMYSQSTSNGQMTLTLTFEVGTDLDQAQVLVQNRVAIAEPRLPEAVRRQGIVTRKVSPDIMMVVHMLSPDSSRDQIYITNYALLQVRDQLARIPGVGDIQVFGAREYAMRVWLDPDKVSSIGMTPEEVVAALRAQNVQVAGGALGAPPLDTNRAFQTSIMLQGRLSEPSEFGNIIVRQGEDGRYTRLSDVARVELGANDYSSNSYLNGQTAVALVMSQRPGANALQTAAQILSTMEDLSQDFPSGLAFDVAYNPTQFIQQSVDAVFQTIIEAVLLVIIVIILFLQTWRAAIIPILTIPISLIGTFAVMSALGFSLNNLTLFGLVLAIGIVVDDAIVVVENVERNLRSGCSPKAAVKRTMTEVGGALVSTTLVLFAVFVPAAFLEGITGQFYRQFAVTIATATAISLFNSFTLSPALSAILLKRQQEGLVQRSHLGRFIGRFFGRFNASFETANGGYSSLVRSMTAHPWLCMAIYAGMIALAAFMFTRVPSGFVPQQDQGYLIVAYQLPPGASLSRTDSVIGRGETIISGVEGAEYAVSFAGFSGATRTIASNAGVTFVGLSRFNKRNRSAGEIQRELQGKLGGGLEEAFTIVLSPPPIPGLGTAGGFRMMVQDRSGQGSSALEAATQSLVAAANQNPNLVGMFSPFEARTPQVFADVDRTRAEILQVPVQNVFSALEVYLGSVYVNDFNLFGRTYRVTAQADSQFRNDLTDITHLRTRSSDGAIVPLGSLVTFKDVIGPDRYPRYNLFPAAEINGNGAPGVSSGEALAVMAGLADEILPQGFDFEWTELAYQQSQQGNTAVFVFALSVLFVFLVLAANYESWAIPLAVILIVPMCLLSAISGIWLRGMDNNILSQIGFVVLISLAAKNAILIVEFAKQREEQGANYVDAAVEAASLRLRPIIMTSLAFILGVIPLMLASGAGAEMRQALGTSVFFGMLGVTVFGLLFTPVFYVLIRMLFGAYADKAEEEDEGCPDDMTESA